MPGDLWLLGPHRLLCGDSTVAADVDRLLDGVVPLLMVTDPPYGVDYDPGLAQRGRRRTTTPGTGKVPTTTGPTGARPGRCSPATSPMSGTPRCMPATVAESLELPASQSAPRSSGPRSGWCISRGDYHWQHEPCWYAVRKAARATGRATASRPRCGTIPAAIRTPTRSTARRSRSSACAGRS